MWVMGLDSFISWCKEVFIILFQWIESFFADDLRMLFYFSGDCKWKLDLSAKRDPET